jgi:hypothetical protein
MDLRLIVRCIFILFLYRCFVVYYVFSLYFRSGAVICVWLSDSPIISIGLIRDYVFRFAGLYAIMLCCMHSTPSGVKMCSNKDTMYCPSTVSERMCRCCVVSYFYLYLYCDQDQDDPFLDWSCIVLYHVIKSSTLYRYYLVLQKQGLDFCIVNILYHVIMDSTFVLLMSCTKQSWTRLLYR